MGDMSQQGLIDDLKSMLKDASDKFTAANDGDFIRLLDFALGDMSIARPYRLIGEITLQSGVSEYQAPAGLIKIDLPLWGNTERRNRKKWNSNYPGPAPSATVSGFGSSKQISLNPAPTDLLIADLGEKYKFYYQARHVIDADAANTTIDASDRHLLLTRAAAQAMTELAANNVSKPVKLGSSGVGSMPKNGTPAALAEQLMNFFWSMANA